MSTRQFQHYEDSVKEFNDAQTRMKNARKELVTHIQQTGTALRKKFVPDNQIGIASITTTISGHKQYPAIMAVQITSSKNVLVPADAVLAIKDYLRAQGWAIKEEHPNFYGLTETNTVALWCI